MQKCGETELASPSLVYGNVQEYLFETRGIIINEGGDAKETECLTLQTKRVQQF